MLGFAAGGKISPKGSRLRGLDMESSIYGSHLMKTLIERYPSKQKLRLKFNLSPYFPSRIRSCLQRFG